MVHTARQGLVITIITDTVVDITVVVTDTKI
jgi:hypothetical protein